MEAQAHIYAVPLGMRLRAVFPIAQVIVRKPVLIHADAQQGKDGDPGHAMPALTWAQRSTMAAIVATAICQPALARVSTMKTMIAACATRRGRASQNLRTGRTASNTQCITLIPDITGRNRAS